MIFVGRQTMPAGLCKDPREVEDVAAIAAGRDGGRDGMSVGMVVGMRGEFAVAVNACALEQLLSRKTQH